MCSYLYRAILNPAGVIKSPISYVLVYMRSRYDNTHYIMMYITCHVISPQLTVQCHKKKTAPRKMKRGSATTDDQFAYFTPLASNSVHRYQWSTEKWEQLRSPPCRIFGLVIIDGELTAVGGEDGYRYTNKLFTLRQGRWVEHYPPMNTKRSITAVVSTSDSNFIVVIGGSVGDFDQTAAVELFHVRSRRWFGLTNLPQALSYPSATICGNEVHIIGDNGDGYSCSLQALLSSDQPIISQSISIWTQLPRQPVKWSTAATLCGHLVIVGGWQGGSNVNSIHQLLHGQWVKIGSMSSDRRECLVVSPSPDKMMIVGGYGGGEDSVEECVAV